MTHAWEFQDQLRVSPDWENTETEYLPDPYVTYLGMKRLRTNNRLNRCKDASAFHNNAPTQTGRMSSAAANTEIA